MTSSAGNEATCHNRAVVVFARAPEPGKTKTRLIPLLGPDGAVDAHMQLLANQLRRLDDLSRNECSKQMWVTDVTSEMQILANKHNLTSKVQPQGDLGLRMSEICRLVLLDHAAVILMGSDCQGIDAAYVRTAWGALLSHDVVIGPAEDGGYGLIGMNFFHPRIFQGVSWGTANVFEETLQKISAEGLSVFCLPEIWDVDTAEDWHRWQSGGEG